MPRKELNFPSRAKRKELLTALQAQMNNDPQLAQDQTYKDYVDAWVRLDQKMENLSAPDDNDVPKLLEEEDADDLAQEMIRTATAGETYLEAARWNLTLETAPAQLAEQFQTLLAKDFGALKKYDPAVKKLSLAELQEGARPRSLRRGSGISKSGSCTVSSQVTAGTLFGQSGTADLSAEKGRCFRM